PRGVTVTSIGRISNIAKTGPGGSLSLEHSEIVGHTHEQTADSIDLRKTSEQEQNVGPLIKQRVEGNTLLKEGSARLKDTLRWKGIVDEWDTETQSVIRKFS